MSQIYVESGPAATLTASLLRDAAAFGTAAAKAARGQGLDRVARILARESATRAIAALALLEADK